MDQKPVKKKRVVVIKWKGQDEGQFEIFSNLKNFCLSYPQYNYNTLNNYLSKEKIPYETGQVRIERKVIITQPKQYTSTTTFRKMVPVVRKVQMKQSNDTVHDLRYWLAQPVQKRLEAVTFIISQSLKKGERMDKSIVTKHPIQK